MTEQLEKDIALDEDEVRTALVRNVTDAIEAGDKESLRKLVEDLSTPDLGDLIELLSPDDRVSMIETMGEAFDFEVFSELDPAVRDQLSEALPNALLARAVS